MIVEPIAALPIAWLPSSYRGHFQQLSPEDRAIWRRFLDSRYNRWSWYAYDVPVGGQECDDMTLPEPIRTGWRYCTAKRIDVLAREGADLAILECRHLAGVSAIGALLVYSFLFHEHNPKLPLPPLYLVTDDIPADTVRAAQHYGITVLVLPG